MYQLVKNINHDPADNENIPSFPGFESPTERLGSDGTMISRFPFKSGLINARI